MILSEAIKILKENQYLVELNTALFYRNAGEEISDKKEKPEIKPAKSSLENPLTDRHTILTTIKSILNTRNKVIGYCIEALKPKKMWPKSVEVPCDFYLCLGSKQLVELIEDLKDNGYKVTYGKKIKSPEKSVRAAVFDYYIVIS